MWFRLKRNDQIGLIFFIAFIVSTSLIYQFEERFNEDDWRNAPTKRHKLVEDLLERELLIGKTKTEVIIMLGPPNSNSTLKKDIIIYDLGSPPSFSKGNPQQLQIRFKNENVANFVVTP